MLDVAAPLFVSDVLMTADGCDRLVSSASWSCGWRGGAAFTSAVAPQHRRPVLGVIEEAAREATTTRWPELASPNGWHPSELYMLRYHHGHHQGWHHDRHESHPHIGDRLASITLSIVVMLSDPSRYAGGRLEVRTDAGPEAAPVDRGTVVVFPSSTEHRVTEVLAGERCSLVAFLSPNP